MTRKELTDEQKQQRREQLARARAARGSKRVDGDNASARSASQPADGAAAVAATSARPATAADTSNPAVRMDREAMGQMARSLLGNPAFDAAYDRAMAEYVKKWQSTAPTDTATREATYYEMKALMAWRHELGRLETRGSLASQSRDRLRAV